MEYLIEGLKESTFYKDAILHGNDYKTIKSVVDNALFIPITFNSDMQLFSNYGVMEMISRMLFRYFIILLRLIDVPLF